MYMLKKKRMDLYDKKSPYQCDRSLAVKLEDIHTQDVFIKKVRQLEPINFQLPPRIFIQVRPRQFLNPKIQPFL